MFGVQLACSSQQECIVPLLHLTKPICNGKLFAAVVATHRQAITAATTEQHTKGASKGPPRTAKKTSLAHTNCQPVSAEGTLKSIQSYHSKTELQNAFFLPPTKGMWLGNTLHVFSWTPCHGSRQIYRGQGAWVGGAGTSLARAQESG